MLQILTTILLLFCIPMSGRAETDTTRIPMTETQKIVYVDVAVLSNRVAEIQGMDRSMLSPEEKMALREELVSIKNELKTATKSETTDGRSGGVYISVGALIIIILLLIIIF